jgi:hypothetical protein
VAYAAPPPVSLYHVGSVADGVLYTRRAEAVACLMHSPASCMLCSVGLSAGGAHFMCRAGAVA